eukprot:MONOS_1965.1-p1 / transcript=MONOS_1965.1 / gene=MONOS_1965 / organism=Monocercomonoides_exilis_PA203 / gene_product=unspecified product / transcript_product=unspecified product / location=Mono_scaffold00038:2422-3688(-) / protein_length=305 / sequence_SO=supercontig / SO=protein_coding / is_pseudo=false
MDKILFQLFLRNGPVLTEQYLLDTMKITPGEIDSCIINALLLDGEIKRKELINQCTIKSGYNAERTLQELIFDEWLYDDNGKVSFGARSYLELESNLLSISDNIGGLAFMCSLCSAVHVGCSFKDNGVKCAHCETKMHDKCKIEYEKKFDRCPVCRRPAQWIPLIRKKDRAKQDEGRADGESSEEDKYHKQALREEFQRKRVESGLDELDDEELDSMIEAQERTKKLSCTSSTSISEPSSSKSIHQKIRKNRKNIAHSSFQRETEDTSESYGDGSEEIESDYNSEEIAKDLDTDEIESASSSNV